MEVKIKHAERQKEVVEIRRYHLRHLINRRYKGIVDASKALGYPTASFLVQMLGPHPSKNITSKTARLFEEKLGLDVGTLDEPISGHTAPPVDIAQTLELIRLVGRVCEGEAITLAPMKLTDVIALALADTMEHGGVPREDYIKTLLRLAK
ncbi:hypothetical protein [Glaciimonas soli]|uniref:Uncharacterized protein n=1 Tax=Glaciimonas soli TaxID=2590999 RepID=A0A843YY07_9BURK|nr:hypothetical protein [Glaciimonas soli]MQR02348.1 hypothetical protein [Glaciimonas soli]